LHAKLEASPQSDGAVAATEDTPLQGASLNLTRVVGENLRRLRTKRGLSLQRLSRASGVSRAMLSQIELGRSSPTINVVWKIAQALASPITALLNDASESQLTVLRATGARLVTTQDGAFSSRPIFPLTDAQSVEFFELRLASGSVESAGAYPPGTRESLVVADGMLRIVVGGKTQRLEPGDAILFDADLPHVYANDGAGSLRLFVVLTYDPAGWRSRGRR
jgi:transcriptional regulator with XRE-family HTH domain